MTNRERGKYIKKYVLWLKKEHEVGDYKKYRLLYGLHILLTRCNGTVNVGRYLEYEERPNIFNPIVWLYVLAVTPFFLITHGLNVIPEIYKEIKDMFKWKRSEVLIEKLNEYLREFHTDKIENFYDFDLELSKK